MTYSVRWPWKMAALLTFLFLATGCSEEAQDDSLQLEPVNVLPADTGKADGNRYSVKDFFLPTDRLPIDDLTDRLASLATDGLNDALGSIPFIDIKLSDTQLFGLSDTVANGSTITDINALVTGLSAEYGEDGFMTELNRTRERFLQNSNYAYFAESEFSVGLNGDTSFSTEAGDVDVRLGFNPSVSITARTVFAHEGNLDAVLNSPLSSAKELRGFVIPRDADDLRNLLPGESVMLSGDGTLAFNFGANLPVFTVSPVDHLVLSARFHLGARVQTTGEIDVQFIRGDGGDLFVDVGMTSARERAFRVAFERGWGLEGIPALLEVAIGSQTYRLGDIAERLVESRLAKASLLDFGFANASRTANERLSVQRFRVDLNTNSRALEQALKQVAGGDLRLLQTLADRIDSGVTEVLSLERGLKEKFKHVGAHVASMRFFSQQTERNGKVVVRSGDQVEEVLFRELEERSGRFWTDWSFRRQVLTGQTWQNGTYLGATSNLRFAVTEADSFTSRDQVLDHVDSALLTVLDFETAYGDLTRQYEELQHQVDVNCRECDRSGDFACERAYDRCIEMYISDSEVMEWRTRLQASSRDIVNSLSNDGYRSDFADSRSITEQLLGLKLDLSSVKESRVALRDTTGRTSILSDVRISQEGLDAMFRNITPTDFDIRMRHMLTMIISKRSREYDVKYDRALDWLDDESRKIENMVEVYEKARQRYLAVDDSSRIGIAGGRLGNGAFIVVNSGDEETLTPSMLTIAEQKALIAAQMVEELVDEGKRLSLLQALLRLVTLGLADTRGFESHHLAAYTLTSLIEPAHREWLISMDFEEEAFPDVRVYSRGTADDGLISAGEFDLDRLLEN